MKIIKGDLVLKKNTTFKGDIKVLGNIRCEGDYYNITALNIKALDIDALNINATDIVCVKRIKKTKDAKTIAYSIIQDRFNRKFKEVM